jgi:hypothetical protein
MVLDVTLTDHHQRIEIALQICAPIDFAAATMALHIDYPYLDEKVFSRQILQTCSAEVQHFWIDGN